jgi:hypothetical protein
MTPITPEAFARLLREADRDRVERFAAALLATGDEDDEDAGTPPVAVLDAPDEDLPVADPRTGDVEPEPVAVFRGTADETLRERARERGTRLLDAPALHERLLYGVDPERADELCEAHLGRPARLDTSPDPDSDGGGDGADSDYGPVATPTAAAPGTGRLARGTEERERRGGRERGRGRGRSREEDRRRSDDPGRRTDSRSGDDGGRTGLAAGGGFAVGVVVAVVLATALGGPVVGGVGPAVPGVGPGATPTPSPTPTATPVETVVDTTTPYPTPDGDATGRAPRGGTAIEDVPIPSSFNASTANVTEPGYLTLRPTCERPPSLVVAIQLGALRNNDATDSGIRTVFAFASPRNRRFTGPFDGFREIVTSPTYAPLVNHSRVDYGPIDVRGEVAGQRITVYDGNGTATTYDFTLRLQTGGRYDGCWMNEGVSPVSTGE